MLTLVALLLAQTPQHRLFQQPNLPQGESFAFFEFAPAGGQGMPAVCSTTAPTGAKGEALAFGRASSATCTKTATGGLATTGIADGDLVTLASGVARVEYDADGVLGLLVERAATNLLLRFIEYFNAAWSDVGTPVDRGTATSPFTGSLSGSAVEIEDDDDAAYEGRSQSITVSSGAAYTAHCYVKGAGDGIPARIVLDGTAATLTPADGAWSIIQVTDASSSSTTITFQVLNGDSVDDVGSIIWGGCQVEAGSYRTSIIPTTSATVTRAAEVPSFAVTGTSQVISMAATLTPLWAYNAAPNGAVLSMNGANASTIYFFGSTTSRFLAGGVFGAITIPDSAPWRIFGVADGVATTVNWDGTTNSGAAGASASRWGTTLGVCEGTPAGAGGACGGIISRICVDPSPTRCR